MWCKLQRYPAYAGVEAATQREAEWNLRIVGNSQNLFLNQQPAQENPYE